VDGAYLIQVSNNPYVLGATPDVAQRRRMDSGRLGVFAVTGATGRDAAEIVTLAAIGQRRLARNWHEFEPEAFEVRSTTGTAYAGVDGEALELATPMTFAIHPRGLRLLVPEDNLALADRRQARQVTPGHLWKVARGIDPLDDGGPATVEG
jgi:diacylglycerol kinase family enzyme